MPSTLDEELLAYLAAGRGPSGTVRNAGDSPYLLGLAARARDERLVTCPFADGSYDALAWRKGWLDGGA